MYEFKGCIDTLKQNGTEIMLSGWALLEKDNKTLPSQRFFLQGHFPPREYELKVEQDVRTDFLHVTTEKISFKANLPEVVNRESLLYGQFHLIAIIDNMRFTVPFWHVLFEQLKHEEQYRSAKKAEINKRKKFLQSENQRDNYASVLVPVGSYSISEDAVIGRQGFAFLMSGSNLVTEMYDRKEENFSLQWQTLLQDRSSRLSALNCHFLQLNIPEKQSIYRDALPYDFQAPTLLYRNVEQILGSSVLSHNGVDVYQALRDVSVNKQTYRKLDSHPSFNGFWTIFGAVLKKLNLPLPPEPSDFKLSIQCGDLSARFATFMLMDEVVLPNIETWSWGSQQPEIVSSFDAPEGKHIGTERIFINNTATCNKTLLIFGNSMCERGDSPLGLTWLFARYFQKVIFRWTPWIEYSQVKQHNPDIVLCQTIERFMEMVPIDIY